jgi:hypothetical protein
MQNSTSPNKFARFESARRLWVFRRRWFEELHDLPDTDQLTQEAVSGSTRTCCCPNGKTWMISLMPFRRYMKTGSNCCKSA